METVLGETSCVSKTAALWEWEAGKGSCMWPALPKGQTSTYCRTSRQTPSLSDPCLQQRLYVTCRSPSSMNYVWLACGSSWRPIILPLLNFMTMHGIIAGTLRAKKGVKRAFRSLGMWRRKWDERQIQVKNMQPLEVRDQGPTETAQKVHTRARQPEGQEMTLT